MVRISMYLVRHENLYISFCTLNLAVIWNLQKLVFDCLLSNFIPLLKTHPYTHKSKKSALTKRKIVKTKVYCRNFCFCLFFNKKKICPCQALPLFPLSQKTWKKFFEIPTSESVWEEKKLKFFEDQSLIGSPVFKIIKCTSEHFWNLFHCLEAEVQ